MRLLAIAFFPSLLLFIHPAAGISAPSVVRSPFPPRSPARAGGGGSAFSPVVAGSPRGSMRRGGTGQSVGSPESTPGRGGVILEPRLLKWGMQEESAEVAPVRASSPSIDFAAFVCPAGEDSAAGKLKPPSVTAAQPAPQVVTLGTPSPVDVVANVPLAGREQSAAQPEKEEAGGMAGSRAGADDWLMNSARQRTSMQQSQTKQQQLDRTLSTVAAPPSQPKSLIQVRPAAPFPPFFPSQPLVPPLPPATRI
jgi:hypothetical protein